MTKQSSGCLLQVGATASRMLHPGKALASRCNRWPVIACLPLLAVLLVVCCCQTARALAESASAVAAEQTGETGSTSAYAEPIKWSFGGWNPLEGMLKQKSNVSTLAGAKRRSGDNQQASSTPMPATPVPLAAATATATQHQNKTAPVVDTKSNRQQAEMVPLEASDSTASSTNDKYQFAMPVNTQHQRQQQQHLHHHHHQMQPAYASQFQRDIPQQEPNQPKHHHHQYQQQVHVGAFSAPAPVPIVRDQVIPPASGKSPLHHQNGAGSMQHQQHQKYHHHHHQQQHYPMQGQMQQLQQQQQHHHLHQRQQQHDRGPFDPRDMHQAAAYYREQHQQRMRQHQLKVEEHQRQHQRQQQQMYRQNQMHSQYPTQNSGHNQAQQLGPPLGGQGAPNWVPFDAPPQARRPQQAQLQQVPVIKSQGFRVLEGEQPALFDLPAQQQQQHHHHHHQVHQPNNNVAQQPYQSTAASVSFEHPTMPAIERENLNYNDVLSQVNEADSQQQRAVHSQQVRPAPSNNNIQDIKQSHYNQEQRALANAAKAASNSNSSYLTIPVAVETEGDKVLTADDINEIEKHVIKVLPDLSSVDKVVKLADTRLTVASLKAAAENHQQLHEPAIAKSNLHQLNYQEHQKTMQQLEADLRANPKTGGYTLPIQQQQQQQTTPVGDGGGPSYGPQGSTPPYNNQPSSGSMGQATTPNVEHRPSANDQQVEQQHQQRQHQSNDYYLAAGQQLENEMGDQEQNPEFQLIKNDLLNSIRYEPTRSNQQQQQFSSHAKHQAGPSSPIYNNNNNGPNGASTPPMGHSSPLRFTPQPGGQPAVTRYFKQGFQQQQQQQHPSGTKAANRGQSHRQPMFGRISGQPTATTRTILGGRKVSEVMRQLIHTTPVPLTSPVHVPSIEPEKLDAIQLIAGQANDQQPIVVEAHQLVNHTPDGGIDYNSGNSVIIDHQPLGQAMGNNASYQLEHQQVQLQHQQQQQPQQARPQPDYLAPPPTSPAIGSPQDPNQGAIIEYVAMTEQALNNAAQQHQTTPQAAYMISGQPELQTVYVNAEQQQDTRAPQDYATTTGQQQMTVQQLQHHHQQQQQQQQQQGHQADAYDGDGSNARGYANLGASTPPTTLAINYDSTQSQTTPGDGGGGEHGHQIVQFDQQQPQQQHPKASRPQSPLADWSPSIASEHQQQQQQLELSAEHVGPMQQLEMPATAGYNNLFNQADSRGPNSQQPVQQQSYDDGQQQPQPQRQQPSESNGFPKWRSKAGGSQPNPDAQYDGQIVKANEEQDDNETGGQEHQQSLDEQQQPQLFSNYNSGQGLNNQQDAGEPAHEHNQAQQQQQNQYQADQQTDNGNDHLRSNEQDQGGPPPSSNQDHRGQVTAVDGYQLNTMPAFVSGSQVDQGQDQGQQSDNMKYEQPHRQQPSNNVGAFNYVKLDRDAQQEHLAQRQAQHKAHLAEIMNNNNNNRDSYTTAIPLTTLSTVQSGYVRDQQQQQAKKSNTHDSNISGDNGYSMVGQDQSMMTEPIPQAITQSDASTMQENPIPVPILDKQSLIPDSNSYQLGDDDASKDQNQAQPVVYQVYQAYYAPKDHRPLPGYVRLSIDEFNDLFRDAEIQYVDRNTNGRSKVPISGLANMTAYELPISAATEDLHPYSSQAGVNDPVKAAASEISQQTIVIDRRSIGDGRPAKYNTESSVDKNSTKSQTRLGQTVRKIISIRNSRQSASKQQASRFKEDPKHTAASTKHVIVKAPDASSNSTTASPKTKAEQKSASSTSSSSPQANTNKKTQLDKEASGKVLKTKAELPKPLVPQQQQVSSLIKKPEGAAHIIATSSKIPAKKNGSEKKATTIKPPKST